METKNLKRQSMVNEREDRQRLSLGSGGDEIVPPPIPTPPLTPPQDFPLDHNDDLDGDGDGDKLAREELLRLNRQYRNMERQGNAYQTGNVSSQRRRVMSFEKERDDLLITLAQVLASRHQAEDRKTVRIILEILDSFETHQAEISQQLLEIAEMDEQVSKITKRVIQQRLKVHEIFGHSMTIFQSQRHQSVLENRLYRATTDFDTQVAKNGVIRRDIDLHLSEKGRFHRKYTFIKKRIAKIKRQMADLVDIATSTYDQREECVSKIKSLRERDDKESRAHVLEMKEYRRLLHNDEKSRNFMETKMKSRPLLEEDELRLQRHQKVKEKYYDDLLRSYRKSFRQILALSSVKDIQGLVHIYTTQDNKNFTQFGYLSNLNSELDFLKQGITALKVVIEEKAFAQKRIKQHQLNESKEAETKFEEAVKINNQRQAQLLYTKPYLEEIMTSINETFRIAECDNSPLLRLLQCDKNTDIRPSQVRLCFQIIERRVEQLQQENAVLQIQKSVEIDNFALPHLVTKMGSQAQKPMGGFIKPRSATRLDFGGGDDDDDDRSAVVSQRPKTYQEIREDILFRYQPSGIPSSRSVDASPSISSRKMTLS